MATNSDTDFSGKPGKRAEGRKRLQPDEREKLIVKEAIKYFADVGFDGGTRELARRIGVTQPLLYRYFPNKESLIERVYQEVYLGRLKPEWTNLITNRSIPLQQRLLIFYSDYQKAIFDYEWVRIFMFSGLRGVGINEKYLDVMEERILRPICAELRAENGFPDIQTFPITPYEMELIWGLHGQNFYRAVRKLIYDLPVPSDLSRILAHEIDAFLTMAPKELANILNIDVEK